jgi:hypothetical protein
MCQAVNNDHPTAAFGRLFSCLECMGDHTMTVTNEDLQRQISAMREDSNEIKESLKQLIDLSTETRLQGQALGELQKQYLSRPVQHERRSAMGAHQ